MMKRANTPARAAGFLVCLAAGAALAVASAPSANAADGLVIPLLHVPLKTQTIHVPMTIPSSSELIGQTAAIDVDGDYSDLKKVTAQISGASCAYRGGGQWTCKAPAGGWVAGTFDLAMYVDASSDNTYLGYLSLEGRDVEVIATSSADEAISATGGYTFDFAGTTPPPEHTPAATASQTHKSQPRTTQPTATGRVAASAVSRTGASVPATSASAGSSLSASATADAAVAGSTGAAATPSSSLTQVADEGAASTKSSSDGPIAGVGIAVALLVGGGIAAGLLTRRRRGAGAPVPAGGAADDGPDADADADA